MIVLARIFEMARMEIPLHLFVGQSRGFMATTFLMPLPLWRTNLLLWAKSEGKSSIFLSFESPFGVFCFRLIMTDSQGVKKTEFGSIL